MGDPTQLSRLSLRRDKILEVPWPQFPTPPPELMKMPGFNTFYTDLKLYNERVLNVFQNVVNNLGVATSTPGQ